MIDLLSFLKIAEAAPTPPAENASPAVPGGSGAGIVSILAGETPPGTAADPAGAF
jgi:hypothetical protein